MRTATIGWFGLALLCCAAPHAPAMASPATSKAANARGMTLMGKKQWAEAEAEFKQAVAEDPSSVKAHYNLASAASRAHDLETAIWEIAWVGDRAAWDDEAKAAAKKAPKDDDLTWALKAAGENGSVWVGEEVETNATDLSQPAVGATAGTALPDLERAKIAAKLGAAPGPHEAKCDVADPKQGKVIAATLELTNEPKVTAVASLKDGIAIIDPSGVMARSEPLGCTGPGASQDQLATLVWLVVPLGLGVDTPHHPPNPLARMQMLAVSYTTGGRREWQTNVAVFARRDKAFVKVFEGLLASTDATGAGHLWQSPLGNLVYSGPGEKKKHAFHWDPATFKFVPMLPAK